MNNCHQNIPFPLLFYTLANRHYGQTQLYLFLKMQAFRGYIYLGKDVADEYSMMTGKCAKTYHNNLTKLFKRGWITIDSRKKELHINGYDTIMRKMGFHIDNTTGVIWDDKYFKEFTAFVYAAIITKHGKSLRWRNRNSETNKGGLSKRDSKPFLILPHLYLAKALGINKSLAQKMFNQAVLAGYITVEHVFEKQPIALKEVNHYKSTYPDEFNKIRIYKDKVCIQMPNRFYSSIELKRKRIKKKSVPILRDIIKGN